ncbi:MAG: hypothetical protein QOE61_2008 [Micromonosporaceae bacterium]|nr:hypothetical protein [Micromonosporaceae bacterium]
MSGLKRLRLGPPPTGVDKPDPADPTKQDYNAYRFNAMRWDSASGTYDMGFRDYDPGLNRFLARDSYNGALSDMGLNTDPWTMHRYAFAGGNPISIVEIDGHFGWADITSGISDAYHVTTNFVSDHSAQLTDLAVTAAGVGLMVLGVGGEIGGFALDVTGTGAIVGVPVNIASAALITAGATMAVAGAGAFAMDTANYEGGSSSSGGSGDVPKIERQSGSHEGAEQLQGRAKELQDRRSWNGGTTSVVKVQNTKTGEVQTWVSTEGKTMPKEWENLLRPDEGERFIPGNGHAEQSIVDNLGEDWKIVEGGTSRNVCITHPTGACSSALEGQGLTIGGKTYPWRAPGVKTDYRTFWWGG